MGWRESLRPASFRGVRFHIDGRSFSTGRRIHNHEYPKRDQNYPEDMGRASRKWSVEAYVIGDDYMARRDALIAACERLGPGRYTDFWGRSGTAACERCEVEEEQHEGRMCRFRLEFVEAGTGSVVPLAIAATASLVSSAAGVVTSAVLSGFASRYKS